VATLALSKIWINRMDGGAAVSAQSSGRARAHDMNGEVRTYAGGRQRSRTVAGERGQFTFRLEDVSLTTVDLLRTWSGRDVQVRDHRGQRFFGVFFGVNIIERKEPAFYVVELMLRTVTVVEGV
jgi:hypothetical protein